MHFEYVSRRLPAAVAAACAATLGFAAAAHAATIDVSPTGDDTTCPAGGACKTITKAISVAATNDTIAVGPGVYVEQVILDKKLNLVGTGRQLTTIASPAGPLQGFDSEASTFPQKPIVFVRTAGSGSVISDLTVDGRGLGLGSAPEHNRFVGVGFDRAGGTVDNVRITRMRNNPLDGVQHGTGVYAAKATAPAVTVNVTDSTIDDYQKNGLTLDGAAIVANISGNTVTGAGPTPAIAQNGIQVSRGATGTVTNNEISGNQCRHDPNCNPPLGDASSGILLFDSTDGVVVSGNTLADNDVQISANGAEDFSATGNSISGEGQWGISVYNRGFGAEKDVTATISGNSIEGQDIGAEVTDDDTGAGFNPAVSFTANRIVGNTLGMKSNTNASLNAERNWFGCNAGPNTAACDTTSGSIDAAPHLVVRAAASPSTIEIGGDKSTASARFDRDSNGAAVNPAQFPDTDAEFATTLGEIDEHSATESGIAKSILTSGATTGTATVTATVDNQSVTTPVLFTTQAPAPTDGADGTNGTNGTNGSNGSNGAPGANGANGAPGAQGPAGQNGLTPTTPSGEVEDTLFPTEITSTSLKPDARKRLAFKLRCPTGADICEGRAILKAGNRNLGTVSFLLRGGESGTFRVALTDSKLKSATKTKKVSVNVVSRGTSGRASQTNKTLKFTALKTKAKKSGKR